MADTQSKTLNGKSIMPSLTVDDLNKSTSFFTGLGFEVQDRWEHDGQLLGVMLKGGNARLGLSQDDGKKGRDRVRKELIFSVENRRRDDGPRPPSKYGGLSLLSGMARLFGWKDFSAAADGVLFVVSWRAPLTRRDQPGKPD